MVPALILWSHALAALLFGALGLWTLRRAEAGVPRNPLAVALMMTALWALAVAGIGETDLTTRIAESGRNLAWLAFMIALHRRNGSERPPAAIGIVYGVVALVILVALALHVAATAPEAAPEVTQAALLLRMMAAVTALVLVQSLHSAITAPGTAGMRPVVLAIGAIWLVDINVLSVAWLTMGWPHQLVAVRGGAMALITAAIAMGLQRRGEWPMQLSRTVAYQSLSLVAIGLYFALLALATSALAAIGGDNARLLQTAFVFGSTAAILTLVSSPWLRAWIKVKLAKHFFRHRYDYRAEWMRFTETLGEPEGSAPLDERIVKALADLTDSPAGLLLVPQGETLGVGAAWNIDRAVLPAGYGESWHLDRIDPTLVLELDTVEGADSAPPSIRSWDQAWVVVPLPHHARLAGAIVLARPPITRALDWEDFDLLKAAGRQLASYLAEERAIEALAEAERFEEFNRRFAFIMHDIKNLVSQLTLVARNAERHADNPAFRADMVATLQDSAGRMNDMLARLSQHHRARTDAPVAVPLAPLARRVAKTRRAQHPVEVSSSGDPLAIADPAMLETLLGHLIQNAIEASAADAPVRIEVRSEKEEARIDVIDRGAGMSPAFIRDKLFKPFVSSKPGGFGIGAFEAQKLAAEMGGRIEVKSSEGKGSRFRVVLRAAAGAGNEVGQAA
ncbi:PEP-CTERM system histidine kinase PrsK [Sphingomonas koreensis]|uniref:histidine kinase n=2 Tax=Sphingomonas koreensis TaxID=93064 RepID=A0A1L6J950_9SPHN|nr:XrtA/PEP-CTERM system histidine kinase PrsK [Sphingomonas koreensis]APR52438.1 histidine kinase [Sphingomonas koreensis]MDC7811602.1 PEP-CTERM system histidine kinase PrsK [Sphingomonas koreensis]RSU19672.1 PEP-CTERM system histidine kinase PrsK [Sphingomonas koreensis]RSU26460.1 PEP-CTERM system histidine kinase PrsK [Sphingomonas koreensis]RSU27242.1 PEP-CTERM system histidine kinase PrsK [Sphingomonas koreensis]